MSGDGGRHLRWVGEGGGGGGGGGRRGERIVLPEWCGAYTLGFVALQADAARTLRRVDVRTMSATRDARGDSRNTAITKKLPVERYCERFNEPTRGPRVTDEWLTECSLVQFTGEIDWAQGGHMVRRAKPRIVKLKPFLNLDMASHQAPRMARMALRLFRPFGTLEEDPWTIDDDEEALRALEEFIKDVACPAWLVSRYEQHNRMATRKRKASERKDECGDKQATEATEAQEDEADDETEQGVLRRQSEAGGPPPCWLAVPNVKRIRTANASATIGQRWG